MEFVLGADGQVLLPGAELKPLLGGLLRPELAASLFGADRLFGLAELRLHGIRAKLDQANLLLSIDLDPAALEPSLVAARESGGGARGQESVDNAALAFTLGLGGEFDPSWQERGGLLSSSWSSRLRLSPALFVLGLVAEADLSLDASPYGSSAGLDAARILYDFPRLGARLQAGIVAAPASSFQYSPALYGLAFGREESLPGSRPGSGIASGSIQLEEEARVSVFVNGNLTRQLVLPAGSYRIDDLPLASGLNEVRVEIEERGRPPRELRLGIPFDQALLGAGTFDYALALGTVREDPREPLGLGHLALGLADRLELGADLEGGYGRALGGLSGLAASPLGSLGLAGALSLDLREGLPSPRPALGLRSFWRFASPAAPRLPRLGAALEYRGPGFFVPGAPTGSRESTWVLSGQAGLPLPGSLGLLSLSGDASWLAGDQASWSLSLGPTLTPAPSTILSLSGGYDWRRGEGGRPRLSLSLTVAPPDRRSLSYQRDLAGGGDTVSLGFPLGELGSLNLNAINPAPGSGDRELDLLGSLNLREAALAASASLGSNEESGLRGGQLSFSASTSLGLAEGALAFARSSGSALAIVKPGPELRGSSLELRPASGAPLLDPRGGVLALSGLEPYSPYVAGIELPDSPPDSRPQPSSVEVLPRYRSIAVIRVGEAASETIRGLLVDGGGKPKPLLSGSLVSAEGLPLEEPATFTDEEGLFECYALPKGRLTIHWEDGSESLIEVAGGEARGVHDLGRVVAAIPAAKEEP